jgi:uncharacterized protein YdaU (DUF1376 family)
VGKNPADQFYWEDWKRDTRCLSLAAKGAWIDLLSDMWFSQIRGRLQMPMTAYARSLGATVEQTEAVIQELMDRNICDYVKESDGSLTLINRRMSREYDQRLRWREKKRLQRTSDGVPEMSSKCLAPSSKSSKSSSSNHKSETKTVSDSVRSVWEYYLEKLGKNPNLLTFSPTRQGKGKARYQEALRKTGGDTGKAVELMKLAVDALAGSSHHVGENDRGKRYDSWEKNLFPSLEKFEWWLERAP